MPRLPDRCESSRPYNFVLGFGVPAALMLALLVGDPSELAGAAVYLASEKAASFVTGSDIVVDGGFLSQTI